MIRIKRVYEQPSDQDGFRVLVDRLWPRGLRKSEARVDLWMKEIAPENRLRKWFSHDPKKWEDSGNASLKSWSKKKNMCSNFSEK